MTQVINCFKESNSLINKKCKEVSIEEGHQISTILFKVLTERKDGIGLAANQIGIDASVAVVNVREPIILINPKLKMKNQLLKIYMKKFLMILLRRN